MSVDIDHNDEYLREHEKYREVFLNKTILIVSYSFLLQGYYSLFSHRVKWISETSYLHSENPSRSHVFSEQIFRQETFLTKNVEEINFIADFG